MLPLLRRHSGAGAAKLRANLESRADDERPNLPRDSGFA
jgi:hypothetical protein